MSIGFLLSGSVSIVVSIVFPDLGLSRLGGGYEDLMAGSYRTQEFWWSEFLYWYYHRILCLSTSLYTVLGFCNRRWIRGLIPVVMGNSATAIFALAMALAVGMVLGALKRFAPNVRMPIALMLGSVALLLGGFLWWKRGGNFTAFRPRHDLYGSLRYMGGRFYGNLRAPLARLWLRFLGYRQPRATAHLGLCWRHCGALTQFLARRLAADRNIRDVSGHFYHSVHVHKGFLVLLTV